METKICSGKHGCGRDLPIDQFPKYFSKQYNTTYYRTYCNECYNRKQAVASRIRRHGSDKYKDPTYKTIKVKKCTSKDGCGRELPVEMFQLIRDKRRKYPYYASICKECSNGLTLNRYKTLTPEQREDIRKYYRNYYQTNPNHRKNIAEHVKRYCKSDKGKAARQRWFDKKMEEDPDFLNKRNRVQSDKLSDCYVRSGLKNMGIIDPSPEIINAKRLQLLLYRETKKKKNGKCSESINN